MSLHQAFKLGHAPAFPDAKKSVWVPDGEGGYDEAMIDNIEGEKVNLRTFFLTLSHVSIPGQCQSRLGGKDFQGESAYASQPPKNGKV